MRALWIRSFSLKLTRIITGLIVTAVGSTTLLSIQREQQNFRVELEQRSHLMLDSLEVSLRDPLYHLQAEVIQELMQAVGQYQTLVTLGYIYDKQGQRLADLNNPGPIYELQVDPIGQSLIIQTETIFDWEP